MRREAEGLLSFFFLTKSQPEGLYFSLLNSLFLRSKTAVNICFSDASVEEYWYELTVAITIN